ncbi:MULTISPECIES: dual specificity protein phosphatase family protein [unclassified Janthinobacterium]|uniref:dual specificity protein phosphatase family protein n=1 Tax=unclassified Janthinobacterium TaxID=2610881 RepID=UPI001E2E32A1|nr:MULTISPECIES: dual specificity protein phosphatase family protein [unclassified Janthinobacterium]MCC7644813.1 dual specificity protein phosphatase family protein [Janthinobacterium sp. EB271-G4-3-1]MCC7691895.1 dual specificity protein phosphatase family protein [Janthinobacterium sp. EB271-G4-3-2]
MTLPYLLLLSLALAAGSAGAQAPLPPERNAEWATPLPQVSNLHQVTPVLYRSAKLDSSDVAQLQALGVKTVISLRSFHSDTQVLEGSGIRAVRIPINTWAIRDKHVVDTMRSIRAAEQQGPVLLHCLHGADRTGMMAAMYRMLYQGWPREKAIDELKNGGYGYHAVWKNIESYLKRVDVAALRAQIEQEKP